MNLYWCGFVLGGGWKGLQERGEEILLVIFCDRVGECISVVMFEI